MLGRERAEGKYTCQTRAAHSTEFADLGGMPSKVLYDRMKTEVIDASEDGHIDYNRSLVVLVASYGFLPWAC